MLVLSPRAQSHGVLHEKQGGRMCMDIDSSFILQEEGMAEDQRPVCCLLHYRNSMVSGADSPFTIFSPESLKK